MLTITLVLLVVLGIIKVGNTMRKVIVVLLDILFAAKLLGQLVDYVKRIFRK